LRIGAAGSITTLIGESSFYFIDAINARSKILTHNVGFNQMLKDVLKTEGVSGLFKGYSACYYSSIMYGYLYFYIYKGFKGFVKETETFK
jgi:Mitochondrial carrier protein